MPPLLGALDPDRRRRRRRPEFGTGAVKVTPAHDPTDYEIGTRHGLRCRRSSVWTRGSPARGRRRRYAGLDRYEARKQIVEELRERGFLLRRIHTGTPSRRANEPATSSSRCSRCSGSSTWRRWPSRRSKRTATDASDSPGALRPHLRTVAGEHSRLERLAADLVGPSAPGWYAPDGRSRRRDRRRSARIAREQLRHDRLSAGPRYARYVVLQRFVAVLDPGLARADAGTALLVSRRK